MSTITVVSGNTYTQERIRQLYSKCIAAFGIRRQEDMVIEECSELITAINHYRRERITRDELLEEVADVLFMIGELSYIHGFTEEELKNIIDSKSTRTESRVNLAGTKGTSVNIHGR